MNRIQVAPNFFLDEFVDPVTYFTTEDHGRSLIDEALFWIAQLVRDEYGKPLTINEWWKHLPEDMSNFDAEKFLNQMIELEVPVWSGLRTILCKIGAPKSAHKLGKAFDIRDKKIAGEEKIFMDIVRRLAAKFYSLGLRRMEDVSITIGWGHFDTNNVNCKPNSIRIIDKTKCTETIFI